MSRLIAPTGHTMDLPPRHLTFGESPQCDIPLTAGYGLAGLHFEIAPGTDGLFYLRDCSGGHGTFINGQQVKQGILRPGDELRLDTIRFLLVAPGMEIPSAQKATLKLPVLGGKGPNTIGIMVAALAASAVGAALMVYLLR